jgi:hypothetical protein
MSLKQKLWLLLMKRHIIARYSPKNYQFHLNSPVNELNMENTKLYIHPVKNKIILGVV